ncbi:MAG TPA: SHD1 domain-containing protein [Thermoguttaceae bacterium]|nr:SHD1 domain-containing protein [Thermoguttaceae bacterium]
MKSRLLVFLLIVSFLPACGRSDPSADAQAEAAAARERQRELEEETDKLLDSVGGVDDLKTQLATGRPQEKAAQSGDKDGNLFRTWTDASRKTLARGEFVSLLDGKVCLQKEDGTAAVIPLEELSQADREYVKVRAPDEVAEDAKRGELDAGPEVEVEEATAEASVAGAVGLASEEVARPDPARREYDPPPRQKVVIPFDFESKFDEGRYGQMVADSIWKKLEREGGFVIPDSMVDVRDLCTANNRKITPATPRAEVADVVRGDFDADVGIWGSVERAPGAEWEIYDLVIKCVDFSQVEPKVIYEVAARTNSVSEIPHLYVKQMLDKLYDRRPGGPPPVDQLAEENWKNNPNLVEGGDFQKDVGGVPVGWDKGWEGGFVDQYESLGNVVKWIPESGNSSNRVIRFTMDQALADSTGVPYYGKAFPIEEAAKYRFQCRWRSNGPSMKVFIKCYDEMGTTYTPESAQRASAARKGAQVPETSQLRECYRSQQNLYGPKNTWNTHTQDFTPKHTKYTPRWGRVMLYAYHPAGVAEFDDVVLKQIVPASPGDTAKNRRHSMESDVTIKDMEDNESRGAEARERLRQGQEVDQ